LFDAAIGSMTRSQRASCLGLYTLLSILDLGPLDL